MSADALSLGRSRGAAIVGRPLDMSVLTSVEPQDATPEATCFSTEVFYGDARVNGQDVTVSPLRSSPTEVTLRVQSSKAIDEPFVTLYVRTTCGPSLSRKYVLLSDSPSEAASAAQSIAPVLARPVEPRLPQVQPQIQPPIVSSSVGRSGSGLAAGGVSDAASRALDRKAALEARRLQRQLERGTTGSTESFANADGNFPSAAPSAAAIARRKARMQAVADKRAQARADAPVQPKASGGDRLVMSPSLGNTSNAAAGKPRVEVLESNGGRSPNLRSSAELLTVPSTDEKTRTQAAALWRMISGSPQDLLRDGERLKALEAEVAKMSALTIRQTQELTAVKADLAKAKTEKFLNPLVFGLGALTLASLGFGLWAWRRRDTQAGNAKVPWWGGADKADTGSAKGPRSVAMPSAAAAKGKNSRPASFASEANDISQEPTPSLTNYAPMAGDGAGVSDFDPLGESGIENQTTPVRRPGLVRSDSESIDSGYGAAAGGSSNRVNAEELFDIQQQADFFLSLGQHDQAIDVLQNHISENLETSAVAYLDLFDIYHKVNKREEFDALRDEFNRVFNAQVPEFDNYGLSSRGLEDYAPAMQRIQALWPSAKVLDVIEESIFRKPDRDNQPFDLTAYRELMLLYGVAKEISEPHLDGSGEELGVDFDLTSPGSESMGKTAKGSGGGFSHTEIHPLSADMPGSAFGQLPASHNLGLDIDLGFFDGATAPVAPNTMAKAAVATASFAAPAAVSAFAHKEAGATESPSLNLDNAINFDLTIDSKFVPPLKKGK